MSPPPPPIDAAEFDAHKDLSSIIVQFLYKNTNQGFSAKEIADALGIREEDVNHAMVKLGLNDLLSDLTGGIISRKQTSGRKDLTFRIEDVTVNGIIYYRCTQVRRLENS
jgi:predicted ArsR family transcriptional regulator